MTRSKLIVRLTTVLIALGPLSFFAVKKLAAGFTTPPTHTRVEIDGVDYGPFDYIAGLDKFSENGSPIDQKSTYTKITLSREFVTDPSLYLWAKERMSRKFGQKDIHLITADERGNMISRKVLRLCQPLSWSVEATNPSLGGFNETIDLAVQEISVF